MLCTCNTLPVQLKILPLFCRIYISDPPPSIDLSHPLALFVHGNVLLCEWARVCYLEGLQEEREECLLRYLAGRAGVAITREPLRLGRAFLWSDYTPAVKRRREEGGTVAGPSSSRTGHVITDSSSGSSVGQAYRDGPVTFRSVLQARISASRTTKQRGRPRGSHAGMSGVLSESAPFLTRTRPRSVGSVHLDGEGADEREDGQAEIHTGRIYTATELIQKAMQHRPVSSSRKGHRGRGNSTSSRGIDDYVVLMLEGGGGGSQLATGSTFGDPSASSLLSKKRARSLSSSSGLPHAGGDHSGKPVVPPLVLSPSVFAATPADAYISQHGPHICPHSQQQSLPDLTVLTTPIPWHTVAAEFTLFNPDEPVDTPTAGSSSSSTNAKEGRQHPVHPPANRVSWSCSPREKTSTRILQDKDSAVHSIDDKHGTVQSPRQQSGTVASPGGGVSSTAGNGLRITVPLPTPASSTGTYTSWEMVNTPNAPTAPTRNFNGAIAAWVTCESPSSGAGAVSVEGERGNGTGLGSKQSRRRVQRSGSSGSLYGEVEGGAGGKTEFRRVAFADVLAPSFREVPVRAEVCGDNGQESDRAETSDEDISDEAVAARHEATLSRMRSRFALIKELKDSLKNSASGGVASGGTGAGGVNGVSPRRLGVSSPRAGAAHSTGGPSSRGLGLATSQGDDEKAHYALMAMAARILGSGGAGGSGGNASKSPRSECSQAREEEMEEVDEPKDMARLEEVYKGNGSDNSPRRGLDTSDGLEGGWGDGMTSNIVAGAAAIHVGTETECLSGQKRSILVPAPAEQTSDNVETKQGVDHPPPRKRGRPPKHSIAGASSDRSFPNAWG